MFYTVVTARVSEYVVWTKRKHENWTNAVDGEVVGWRDFYNRGAIFGVYWYTGLYIYLYNMLFYIGNRGENRQPPPHTDVATNADVHRRRICTRSLYADNAPGRP